MSRSGSLIVVDIITLTKIDGEALSNIKATLTRRPQHQNLHKCNIHESYSKVGTNISDGKFVDGNSKHILVTSGYNSNILCEWCRLTIDSKIPIGIPISYVKNKITTRDGEKRIVTHVYEFKVIGTYCDFSCCLAEVDMMKDRYDRAKNSLYAKSEFLLNLMYVLNTGGSKPLKKRRDRRLLKSNGGSLTRQEFRDGDYDFIECSTVTQAKVINVFKRIENF